MSGGGGQPQQSPPRAGLALALLFAINLLNYLDRYVLSGVLPLLQKAFPDTNKATFGFLANAFLWVYMIVSPIFGRLGDRVPRKILIGIGVQLWSIATAAGGFAKTYTQLFVSRMFVGVGEAAYGTAAPTVISDLYPRDRRGWALSIFYIAIPVGSALGYVLGGVIGSAMGWRAAFFIVGVPGLLAGFFTYMMREPKRGGSEGVSDEQLSAYLARKVGLREILALFRNKSYVVNTLAMAAFTFAIGGISYWMPEYLHSSRNLPLAKGNTIFGGITVVAGLLGTLIGGTLADRLNKRFRGSYFSVSGVGMLLAVPAFYVALVSQTPAVYWTMFFIVELMLFLNTGPSNTIIVNVTEPSLRTTAFAINVFLIHLLGDAASPTVLGAIADKSDLGVAFRSLTAVVALSGILWVIGSRFYMADTDRVAATIGDAKKDADD
ncbi:MAG: MFS transporter [Myxococcales bacterium]|nr:MFS transporter [Myxococcales bacterium]